MTFIESFLYLSPITVMIWFFIFGSFFGSFANVLIYRILILISWEEQKMRWERKKHSRIQKRIQKRLRTKTQLRFQNKMNKKYQKFGKFDIMQRSYCPSCHYQIPFYLNIPIFAWFLLRGHCANCSNKISFRYPFVEFLMALVFTLLFLSLGWKWFLLEALIFSFMLIVSCMIDWEKMILPDSFTLLGMVIGLLGAYLNPERAFQEAFLGVLLGGGSLLLISYLYYVFRKREGLGGGDIKMMAWIGAVLGWEALFFVLMFSCLLGTFIGIGIILQSNKKIFETALPFGPYLALSAFLYILLKENFLEFLEMFLLFPL